MKRTQRPADSSRTQPVRPIREIRDTELAQVIGGGHVIVSPRDPATGQ